MNGKKKTHSEYNTYTHARHTAKSRYSLRRRSHAGTFCETSSSPHGAPVSAQSGASTAFALLFVSSLPLPSFLLASTVLSSSSSNSRRNVRACFPRLPFSPLTSAFPLFLYLFIGPLFRFCPALYAPYLISAFFFLEPLANSRPKRVPPATHAVPFRESVPLRCYSFS